MIWAKLRFCAPPGAIALTRILSRPSSLAALSVMPTITASDEI